MFFIYCESDLINFLIAYFMFYFDVFDLYLSSFETVKKIIILNHSGK